jgi:hypothetical protein
VFCPSYDSEESELGVNVELGQYRVMALNRGYAVKSCTSSGDDGTSAAGI